MLQAFEKTVRKAGELALSRTLASGVHQKGRGDFVTDADLAVSDFLKEALPRLVSDSRVLSEEGAIESGLSGKLFLVDPIDGTTNLMYHMNLSAVSCALARDGELCMAAVYNPFTDEMFLSERGCGATLNGRPIRVNNDAVLSDAVVGVEAGPATVDSQRGYFDSLFAVHSRSRGIRFTGSAALDLCYTACGRFSASVFHYLYPWDYAAGWLILEEAGGTLTLLEGGRPTLTGRSPALAASNGLLHQELCAMF